MRSLSSRHVDNSTAQREDGAALIRLQIADVVGFHVELLRQLALRLIRYAGAAVLPRVAQLVRAKLNARILLG